MYFFCSKSSHGSHPPQVKAEVVATVHKTLHYLSLPHSFSNLMPYYSPLLFHSGHNRLLAAMTLTGSCPRPFALAIPTPQPGMLFTQVPAWLTPAGHLFSKDFLSTLPKSPSPRSPALSPTHQIPITFFVWSP